MSTKIQLTTKLDQRLTMSPQLRQAINLLQYNTIELKQIVQQCLEKNPFLENETTDEVDNSEEHEGDSHHTSRHTSSRNAYSQNNDDKNHIENYSSPKSLREHLLDQSLLCRFDHTQQIIAEAIIDAIDENGMLTSSLSEIQQVLTNQIAPTLSMIEEVLNIIQMLDPPGVAHRDLRECLLLQLNALSNRDKDWQIAHDIIYHHHEKFIGNNLKIIASSLKVSVDRLDAAVNLIRSLNPKPGLLYSSDIDMNIEPDLYVRKIKNTWRVYLSENILTNLKIYTHYQELIKLDKKHSSYEALNRELQEAQWLMKGLKRRNETLLNVATYIIEKQKDFLDHGHAFMKPMNIIDVSQALNLHESTVSRVTTEKYIATSRGMLELKYFFPSYVLKDDGQACSATSVKAFIKDILMQEKNGHIYSDSEIANLLKQKGINIARRTVAKYREAMKILPSYQRGHKHHTIPD